MEEAYHFLPTPVSYQFQNSLYLGSLFEPEKDLFSTILLRLIDTFLFDYIFDHLFDVSNHVADVIVNEKDKNSIFQCPGESNLA